MAKETRGRGARLSVLAAAAAAAAGLGLIAGEAQAQDEMSFGEDDARLRAYVTFLTDAGLGKKERMAILNRINDYVGGNPAFNLQYEQDVKGAANKKSWAAFGKCKDIACLHGFAREFGIDRLIVVEVTKESGGFIAVDIELDDTLTGRVLNYTAAVTDTPDDLTFLDDPMNELLKGQNDVGGPMPGGAVASSGVGGPGGGGDDTGEPPEEPGEPFVLTPTWAYLTWGGAGVLALTGGIFGFLAQSVQSDLRAEPHDRAMVDQLIADGESNQQTANILFISAAGVAAVGGLLFWLADDVDEDDTKKERVRLPSASRIEILLAPGAVGVQGAF